LKLPFQEIAKSERLDTAGIEEIGAVEMVGDPARLDSPADFLFTAAQSATSFKTRATDRDPSQV
jgi:hypothetical protein